VSHALICLDLFCATFMYILLNISPVLEEDTYILTTDADVRFDADSVEALLDRLIRDPNVGAVCGRTHPLGHGPLVWYQMFDYAIGHWFQKVRFKCQNDFWYV
jgi:cellulose synthase/poly-beta-1,6-N-acetylglucosamine synthase-like glycosyltransferase